MASQTIIFGEGWGRAGGSEGAWDEDGIASFLVSASIGSETVIEGTGVTVTATGVQSVFSFGTYSVTEGTGVTIVESGVEGAFSTGSEAVSTNVIITPTGEEAGSGIGSTIVTGGITFSVTGVEAAGATGSETIVVGTGVTVSVTGVAGAGAIGTASVASIVIGVTGILLTGTINSSVIWRPIVPSQDPSWVEIGSRAA